MTTDFTTLSNDELHAQYKAAAIMSDRQIACADEFHRRATALTGKKFEIITEAINVVMNAGDAEDRTKATAYKEVTQQLCEELGLEYSDAVLSYVFKQTASVYADHETLVYGDRLAITRAVDRYFASHTRAQKVDEICRSFIARYEVAQDEFMTYSNEKSFVSAIESRAATMIAHSVAAGEAATILKELKKDEANCIENLLGYIKAEREYFGRRGVSIATSTNLYRNLIENTRLEAKAAALFDHRELFCELENALASVPAAGGGK